MTNPASREIKFRAWDKFTSAMCIVKSIDFLAQNEKESLYLILTSDEEYLQRMKRDIELMQFTGLHDKNGKEIYEGDILNKQYHNMNLYDGIGIIEMGFGSDADGYDHGSWYGWKCGESSLDDVYKQAEIIGNIYENPNLLEKK